MSEEMEGGDKQKEGHALQDEKRIGGIRTMPFIFGNPTLHLYYY